MIPSLQDAMKGVSDPRSGLLQEQFLQALTVAMALSKSTCKHEVCQSADAACARINQLIKDKHLLLGQPQWNGHSWTIFYFVRES